MRCDVIAEGVIAAAKNIEININYEVEKEIK